MCVDHAWKAFMPNLLGVPGTYATTGVMDAAQGKTDVFGREQSVTQAVVSSFGVKLGSYPTDVLTRGQVAKFQAERSEIENNIAGLKRQLITRKIDRAEFDQAVGEQAEKIKKLDADLRSKVR